MKLLRINHTRCSESTYNYTYAWVEDDASEAELKKKIVQARDEYLDHLKEWKAATPPNGVGMYTKPQYKNYPDLTVKEVDELHEKLRDEYQAWQAVQSQSKQAFSKYLENHGITPVQQLDPGVTLSVNWGHNHGVPIEYDETRDNDIKGPGYNPDEDRY